MSDLEILRLFISPAHNYFGHHGRAAGTTPIVEVPRVHCRAGQGIEGDRFFEFKAGYKGQITFLSSEVVEAVLAECGAEGTSPGLFRRNVLTRGRDLNELIGAEFEVHGIRFAGMEECRPCHWMNEAVHPRAEALLKGRGGLRARILSDGWLVSSS